MRFLADGSAEYLRQAAARATEAAGQIPANDGPLPRPVLTALEVARDEAREAAKLADRAYKRP